MGLVYRCGFNVQIDDHVMVLNALPSETVAAVCKMRKGSVPSDRETSCPLASSTTSALLSSDP